jgi:hypothetical protein
MVHKTETNEGASNKTIKKQVEGLDILHVGCSRHSWGTSLHRGLYDAPASKIGISPLLPEGNPGVKSGLWEWKR